MQPKVYVKFPKAGLGNKLLTWSRAYVFAELNGFELHTSSWFSLFWGAWFRRENRKRIYIGYFKRYGFITSSRYFFCRLFYKKIEEPVIEKLSTIPRNTLYVFNKTYRTFDFFDEVRPNKTLVKQGLYNMLTPLVKTAYEKTEKPVIGMHVRRGDFKFSNTITPLGFFIEVLEEIRTQTGEALPVTVFTDADKEDLSALLNLSNVSLAQPNADIVDILLLASSKYLITSVSSTFSYWSAFLSDGIIIKPPEEWHVPFRTKDDQAFKHEILWDIGTNHQTFV